MSDMRAHLSCHAHAHPGDPPIHDTLLAYTAQRETSRDRPLASIAAGRRQPPPHHRPDPRRSITAATASTSLSPASASTRASPPSGPSLTSSPASDRSAAAGLEFLLGAVQEVDRQVRAVHAEQ